MKLSEKLNFVFEHIDGFQVVFFVLPLIFFAAFALPYPFGKGLFLANDFSSNRIWWTQMDTYFLSKGLFPLWNPSFEMGHPWLAMSTGAGSLYPLRWWTYLPTYFGGNLNYVVQYVQISLHMGIGMLGIYLILKKYAKVSQPAAFIGASSFFLNQCFNTFTRFPHGVEDICWVPWLIFFSLNLCLDEDFSLLSLFGLILSMDLSWMTGYGQFTYVGVMCVAFLCTVNAKSIKSLGYVIIGGVIGTLLAIGAIYPAIEWVMSHPLRNGKSIANLSLLGVTEYQNIFLNPFGVDVHTNAYTYPFFFILFGLGLLFYIKNKVRFNKLAFSMLFLFILLLDVSRGPQGMSFVFYYKYLPFFGAFNGPAKLAWLAFIPFAWFSAIGFDWLLQFVAKSKANKNIFYIGGFFLTLGIALLNKPSVGAKSAGIWQPLKVLWLTPRQAQTEYLILLLVSTIGFLILLRFQKKWIQSLTLMVLSWIFAIHFATITTWSETTPDKAAQMSSSEAFPYGLLGPRTLNTASISNIGMTDPIVDPPMWELTHNPKNRLIVGRSGIFPESRFVWRPNDGTSPVKIYINSFNPNFLDLNIESVSAGELIYLEKYAQNWTANHDFKLAQPFNDFYSFSLPPGPQNIKMEFRPIRHIAAAIISVAGFFTLISFILFSLFRKMNLKYLAIPSAVLSFSLGIVFVGLIILGSFSNTSLDGRDLFGLNQKFLNKESTLKAEPPIN